MKKAIILGGTKGLGRELAKTSSKRGYQPIIYGRSCTEEQIQKELPAETILQELDLADSDTINQLEFHSTPVQYFFWVAGVFLKKRVVDTDDKILDQMIDIHFRNPIKFIKKFLNHQKQNPFHLVTIASSSSWRLREDEAIYCGLKAAQATFTRNIAVELARDLPGSKVTLINPGGLQTPNFWKETEQDISEFLDPAKVAETIWDIAQNQQQTFTEVQILRRKPIVIGSEPIIEFGPKTPETVS